MGIYEALYPEEEEEDELTPSQKAAKEMKAKGIYEALYPEEEEEPEPEKGPSFLKRAVTKVKEFFKPKPQIISPVKELEDEKEDLDFNYYLKKLKAGVISLKGGVQTGIAVALDRPVLSTVSQTKNIEEMIGLLERDIAAGKKTKFGVFRAEQVEFAPGELEEKKRDLVKFQGLLKELEGRETTQKKLKEAGQKTRGEALKFRREEIEAKYKQPRKWSGEWLIGEVLENTPQFLGSFGLGVATTLVTKNPAIGLSAGFSGAFVQESGFAYQDAREFGLGESESQQVGVTVGTANAVIELLPIGNYISNLPGGQKVKSTILKKIGTFVARRARQGSIEGVTETIQELVSNAVKETYDEDAELFVGLPESGAIGFLLGLLAPGDINTNINVQDQANAVEEVDRITEEAFSTPEEDRTEQQQGIVDEIEILRTEEEGIVKPIKPTPPPKEVAKPTPPTEVKPKKPPVEEGRGVVPKELESLVKKTEGYKDVNEFVAASIFTGALSGVETKALESFSGKTIADQLENFYNQVTKKAPAKPVVKEGKELDRESLSDEQFKKLKDSYLGDVIGQKDRVRRPVKINDKLYISTGSMGTATDFTISVSELIPIAEYKGETFTHAEAVSLPDDHPSRYSYEGTKVAYGKDEYVLSGGKEISNKIKPKKAPAKPVKKPKPKKIPAKPVARLPVKLRKITLREVTRPKAKIFRASERKQLQQEVRIVIAEGKTQEESTRNVDKFLTNTFNQANDPLYERKLKAIRAELKRNMYELVGATTGNWKKDYTYFQEIRHNPEFAGLVDRIEDGIFQIDDIVNPAAPSSIGLATTGTKPIGAFEKRAEPKKGTDEFKLFEKAKELTRKYAQIIGEGYTPRGALGVYYPKTKNVFVNALNDLSVVSHEITHFLDKTYNISDKLLAIKGFATNGNPIYDSSTLKYRKAITSLYMKYYDGGKKTHKLRKRTLEGFATLLQKYVESPQTITEEYPLLVNSFLKKGGEYYHPVMGEIIKDLNKIVKDYQGLSALDKIGSRVVTGDAKVDKPSFLNFRDRLRTFIADELYPIEVLAKKSKRHFVKADPSLWLRAYSNVSGIVNNNINRDRGYWTFVNGDIKKTHDFNWKTLHKDLEARKETDDFNYYLTARREHFSYKELTDLKANFLQAVKVLKETPKKERLFVDEEGKTVIDRAKEAKIKYQELNELLTRDGFVKEEVDKAYFENKTRFIKEEKMFDILTREDLKFLSDEDVQLITPKQYEELTSKQGYASFKRQFYNEVVGENNEIPIQTRVGKNRVSSLLRRKGSQQAIISPLTSAIHNHSEIMRKGLRQIVYNKITDIGVSAAFPETFQDLQLKVSIDPKTGAFFYPQEKDPSIIMGRLDYKRKPILVDAEIKNVLDNVLTYRNIDTFVRLYTGLSRLFTAGTTGYYPPFAVVNLLRDQITAQANTVNKYKTLYSPIREFGKVLLDKNSAEYGFYEEYLVMGGERQTFTGWQKLPPDKLAQRIRDERSGIKRTILLMEKGTNILSAPAKYSEIITRATEYILARKAGKPTIVALEQAGRLTAPFHHLGSWGGRHGQVFIRGLPYFNATLQVLDQHARIATTPDGKKRMLVVFSAITASYLVSMMALLEADDEQKEQYKDLEPEELARYLYFPHPSGKKLIRLPMSEVFTPAGTIFNMIIADEFLKAKYTQADYIHAATAILPDQFDLTEPKRAFLNWIPQVFKSGTEVVIGVRTYPEVTPLESMSMKNLPPELRVNRNTSRFAKWLGKRIGISPIKIDYLITGYLGRGANIALGKPDAWNFKGSVLRDYWFSNGRRVSGTYDKREENDQKYTAYQRGEIELSDKEAKEIYRVKMLTNEFAELMTEFRKADIEENDKEAAELRTEIIITINDIETGKEPKGYRKWVKGAKKRRKDKIKKLKKTSFLLKDFIDIVIDGNPFKVKPVYAAELKSSLEQEKEDAITARIKMLVRKGRLISPLAEHYEDGVLSKLGASLVKATERIIPKRKKAKLLKLEEYDSKIDEVFSEDSDNARRVLKGENAKRVLRRSKEDQWQDYNYKEGADGKVTDYSEENRKTIYNQFSKKEEWSEDRGLYRINNLTFYTFLGGKKERKLMYEAGVIPKKHLEWKGLDEEKAKEYYELMYDPEKSIKMAKIIFDEQGWCGWFAAPDDLVKHCSWYKRQSKYLTIIKE